MPAPLDRRKNLNIDTGLSRNYHNMPPINLDEIIHYRPPTEKTQFQAPQSIGLYPHGYPNLSSEAPIPSRSFHRNEVWPGAPLSTNAHGPRMIFRPPVESGPSLPPSESAAEVAFDLPDDLGLDFPNVTLENFDDPVSLSGQGDYCDKWGHDDGWRKGTNMLPLKDPGESDSVKEPSVSSLALLGDEHSIVAEANESGKKILPSRSPDAAKVEDRKLQNSSATVSTTAKEHLNTKFCEHALSSTDEKNHDPPSGLPPGEVSSSTGDVEVGPDELRLKSPVCTNSEVIPPDEHGSHLIAECCEGIQAEANEAAFTDAENELSPKEVEIPSTSCESNRISSSGRRPISMSPISPRGEGQSEYKQIDTGANMASVSKLQSVVITNSRSRAPPGRSKRKRGPSTSSHDDSCSDGSSDADDADYVSESSILSPRSKRAERAAVQSSPAHLRHNKTLHRNIPSRHSVFRASKNKDSHQVTRDQRPISSLSDMETIPIRGFLTREILLSKVVYSITFEERNEGTCLQEPGGTPSSCEHKAKRRKPHLQKTAQVGKPIGPARVLSNEDELLIELKERRKLKWKEIGEYFPKRSVGSLQVRYSTRLKSRGDPKNQTAYSRSRRGETCQSSGLLATNVNSRATEGPLRQRYGPPRRRQTVDRYSPV